MQNWSSSPVDEFISAMRNTARDLLLGRDTTAAIVRFLIWGAFLAFYWLALVVRFDFPGELPASWMQDMPAVLFLLLNITATFFHPDVLLHLLPVILGSLAGLFLGGVYLSDLFELESLWIGIKYLLGAQFGLSYPRLKIDRGDVDRLDPSNPIKRIGGPGYIQAHLGYAAVFEDREGKPRVYALAQRGGQRAADDPEGGDAQQRAQSTYFIAGFERLRDVIDLRDRLAQVDEIHTETRDGVELVARDAQMLFRVFSDTDERSLDDPYPYDEQSLRRLVYGRPVLDSGLPAPESLLARIVEEEVQSFVARYSLEEFLALQPHPNLEQNGGEPYTGTSAVPDPRFQITRRELTDRFHTQELQARLKDHGMALAWVGVGAWELGGGSDSENQPGAGKTLLETWRNYQRLQLYSSPEYLNRQKTLRFQERVTEIPRLMLSVWHSGKLPHEHRCYELLAQLLRQLSSMQQSDQTLSSSSRQNLLRLEEHLERLVKPDVLGG